MADTKISDLSVEITPPAASDHYVAAQTDTTNTAVPASMVTLAHAAGADSDTPMAIGTLYVTDMSGWSTADRTYTLPTTAAVGSRIGIMISAGDASHELIITAAASDTLNAVAGGTEWSRLFITGEVVIMRCVTADSAWITEHDGRIACLGFMSEQSNNDGSGYPSGSSTTCPFATTSNDVDIGGVIDFTNNRFNIRRAGIYFAYGDTLSPQAIDDGEYVFLNIKANGTSSIAQDRVYSPAVDQRVHSHPFLHYEFAVGDYIELLLNHNEGSTLTWSTAGTTDIDLSLKEIL